MSAVFQPTQRVYNPGEETYRVQQKSELLLYAAEMSKYLFSRELAQLRATCKTLSAVTFSAVRALRIEQLVLEPERLDFVTQTTHYWQLLSQKRWSECETFSPKKTVFLASSSVNLNIYWRSTNQPRCQRTYKSILVVHDVAFNTPQVIAIIKTWQIYKKGEWKVESASLGNYLYLKFLGGNPDNLYSPNRVNGSTRALVAFLSKKALSEGFKGIYLEALPSAQEIFIKLGFVALDKEAIECGNLRCHPMMYAIK